MLRKLLALLLLVPVMAVAATDPSINITRSSAFSWQCQNADGSRISNHNSDLEAFAACTNLSFKDGKARMVQGGQWKVQTLKPTAVTPPPVQPPTPPATTGSAALSWSAPTQNTDGSALTDLAGYRVYHGRTATNLTDIVQLPSAATTSYAYGQLTTGTHYFAVAAYNTSGVESALSGVGSKTVP